MAIADLIEASANQIDRLERAILVEAKRDENMRRLTAIPGLGAIMAATIKALVPDPGGFKSARRFAAWLGLTLRPHSSGGKERLGRISKTGNPELRTLRVVGATAVLRVARTGNRTRPWLRALLNQGKPYPRAIPHRGQGQCGIQRGFDPCQFTQAEWLEAAQIIDLPKRAPRQRP
jgi:transposase